MRAGWTWDLGTVYGGNTFGFRIKNTANVSLGPTSPTEFDAGKLKFKQSTTTLDLNRDFKDVLPFPVNVAAGAEFRADNYEIVAGEFGSWRNGGVQGASTQAGNPTTRPGAPGSQVFPGFKADSGGEEGRRRHALAQQHRALRSTCRPISRAALLVDVAGRYENYSDFGSTTTGKLSTRLQLAEGLRAARLGQHRLPRPVADAGVLLVHGHELRRGRAVRHQDLPRQLGRGDRARLIATQGGEVAQLRHRLRAASRCPACRSPPTTTTSAIDDRIVLSNNFTGATGHRCACGDRRHGRAGRALLHQRDRHQDARVRRHRQLWPVDRQQRRAAADRPRTITTARA